MLALLWLTLCTLNTLCGAKVLRVRLSSAGHFDVVRDLKAQRALNAGFRVLHIGPPESLAWSYEVADAVFGKGVETLPECWPEWAPAGRDGIVLYGTRVDARFCCRSGYANCFSEEFSFPRCCDLHSGDPRRMQHRFSANTSHPDTWAELSKHVAEHGKFDFVIYTDTLEKAAQPAAALRRLPALARAGYLAVPSAFAELALHSAPGLGGMVRGELLQRWLFSVERGVLHILPKTPFAEVDPFYQRYSKLKAENAQLNVWWKGSLPYKLWDYDLLDRSGTQRALQIVRKKVASEEVQLPNRVAKIPDLSEASPCESKPSADGQPYLGQHEDVAFVTYVSSRRLLYVDGAVLLAQSLKLHAPRVKRMALHEELDVPPVEYVEHQLHDAGWDIIVGVPRMHPRNAPPGANDGLHAKAMLFKPDLFDIFDRIVYIDSDAWVRSPRVAELLRPGLLSAEKPIAMVRDANTPHIFNTGVMVLRPMRKKFERIYELISAGIDNDQPNINEAYEGQITELSPEFNVHARMVANGNVSAADAVIAHFTGQAPLKAMSADPDHLREVRAGRGEDPDYGLSGAPCLSGEYFRLMAREESLGAVSYELQRAVRRVLAGG